MTKIDALLRNSEERMHVSVKETVLRDRLLRQTVFAYGILVSLVAGIASVVIYLKLG